MNLTHFKRRLLDSFLVTVNITKMETNVEYEERVFRKNFYTFIGINIYGICLTYDVDYKENSEFWLHRFKDIRNCGVNAVMYLVSQDIETLKGVAVIRFQGAKVIESNFTLTDKVNKHFLDNFDNHFPADLTNLYKCKDLPLHEEHLIHF